MVKNAWKYDYVIKGWPCKGHVFIECPLAKKQTNVEKAKSAAKTRRDRTSTKDYVFTEWS